MMLSTNDVYQKGQTEFAKAFKQHLKKNRNWNIEIQWGKQKDRYKDQIHVVVEIQTTIVLTLDNEDVETFGTDGLDKVYQVALLEKKERELVKKFQQKQTSHLLKK